MAKTRGIRMLLGACAIALLLGCATAKDDFDRAVRADTVAAYQGFLRQHASGEWADRAHERLRAAEARQQAEKERLARAELEAWSVAEREPSIDRLASYLELYPNSARVPQAHAALRRSIAAEVLAKVGGQRAEVRPGTDFPLRLFSEDDCVRGLGEMMVNFIVRYGIESYTGFSFGFQRVPAGTWRSFVADKLQATRSARIVELQLAARSMKPVSEVRSSANPGATVRLYQDSDPARVEWLRWVVVKRYSGGSLVETELAVAGSGVAVLQRAGAVEVYAFGAAGRSMVGEP